MVLINAEPSLSDTINSPDLQSPKNRPQCMRMEVRGGTFGEQRTYINPVSIEPPSKSRKNKGLQ